MAREMALLSSQEPVNIVPAEVKIHHVQLRDVLICPKERGVVNYVRKDSIVEHNMNEPDSAPRTLANLPFAPNTLASMKVPGTDTTLLAAGGQETEIHLSLHGPPSPPEEPQSRRSNRKGTTQLWRFEGALVGASILNSVLLTSMNLTRSNESSIEPRVVISNNDETVKFYDVPVRGNTRPSSIKEAGVLQLGTPVNHSSLSPDGRTLLSVGDSTQVFLHRISGGSRLMFDPITTLSVPPADPSSLYFTSNLAASFSTAFSANGTKFAVASQEGAVVIWDVRSSKPLKVFQTDKARVYLDKPVGNGAAGGWLSDDPFDWTRGSCRAPGWGARNVKFGSADSGREILTFTEHTSLLHVIDARTFETEEIVRMPSCAGQQPPPLSPRPSSSQSRSRSSSPSRIPPQTMVVPPPPRMLEALGDTFRISASNSSDPRTSLSSMRIRSRLRNRTDTEADEDTEPFIMIPALGDAAVENEVRQLFDRHGIRTVGGSTETQTSYSRGFDAAAEDEEGARTQERESMEVDELESDCIDSHTPSRTTSPAPAPSTHIPLQVSSSPVRVVPPQQQPRLQRRPTIRKDDLDIAGLCFDPSGGFIYVASVDGVAEWSIRGAEKRWWSDSQWA